jgi:hypothetical protein
VAQLTIAMHWQKENTSTASHGVGVEETVYNNIEKYVLHYTFKLGNLKNAFTANFVHIYVSDATK